MNGFDDVERGVQAQQVPRRRSFDESSAETRSSCAVSRVSCRLRDVAVRAFGVAALTLGTRPQLTFCAARDRACLYSVRITRRATRLLDLVLDHGHYA